MLATLLAEDDADPETAVSGFAAIPDRAATPEVTAIPPVEEFRSWPVWRLIASFSLAVFSPFLLLAEIEGTDLQRILLAIAAAVAWAVPALYFRSLGAVIRGGYTANIQLQAENAELAKKLSEALTKTRELRRGKALVTSSRDRLRSDYNLTSKTIDRLRDEAAKHSNELSQNSAAWKERLADVRASLKRVECDRDVALEELQQKTAALDAETMRVNELAARIEALEFENVDLQQQAEAALTTFKQRENWSPVAISDEDLARALASSLK